MRPAIRRVRRIAFIAYFAGLVILILTYGVPTGRGPLTAIVLGGLALTSIGRGWRAPGRIALDWLPFTAVLYLYDATRGLADRLGIALHESDVLQAERWCFGGTEPTVWLQQHLYDPSHVYWYDGLCTLVYTSHFVATPVLAAILWLRNRGLWLRFISRVVLLSVAGLITYCLFPEAPPWMAAQDGLSPTVERLSPRGWEWLHLGNLNHALTHAQGAGANPVAATPSLHFAFALLIAIMIGGELRSRYRYLLLLYPLAMGYTLVYTGEHYVLDLVAGAGYALAVHAALCRWERRRARRRPAAPVAVPPDDLPELELAMV